VAAVAGASSIALLSGQAGALSSSSLVPAIALPSPTLQLSGTCVPEYAAAGVGSNGGLQYEVQGTGASSNTNTVATQVDCEFFDTDANAVIWSASSGYTSGVAAALTASPVVHTLDNFVTCVKVDRFDKFGNTSTTGWIATNGSRCS
jgi:hypothetical protein